MSRLFTIGCYSRLFCRYDSLLVAIGIQRPEVSEGPDCSATSKGKGKGKGKGKEGFGVLLQNQ